MTPDGRPRGPETAPIAGIPGYRDSQPLWNPWPFGIFAPHQADWRLQLDPDEIGLAAGWSEHGLPESSVPAEVPGVWNTVASGYAGVGWYETRFRHKFFAGGSIRLVIGGANYLTDAWLNGIYLGRHEGGYDAFAFRCTDVLHGGENRLTLRIVDPPLDGEIDGLSLRTCPTAKESWYGGAGGPWGGVWLERTWEVWIQDVRVHADLTAERVAFRITLASDTVAPKRLGVRAQIDTQVSAHSVSEATHRVEGQVDGTVLQLTVPFLNPRVWSPESPTLYRWRVHLEGYALSGSPEDVVEGHLGFRTCEWRDGLFYLNGEPRFLKGALLQPTVPRTIIGPARDYGDRDIGLARNAGINLLRCHLRPPPYRFLNRCDAAGMMTYVEPPLAWIEPSGRLLEHGKRELAAMVRACGNHPSVVMWGIFNENARATEAVGGELLAELARLDPTRPIIENSGGAAVGETGMWAWGGQSRCWSPGWEAPRPLNDVHAYLANPLRSEARDLLTTLGDGPTLDVTPGRAPADRIESRLSADAMLVSEYGCGALPDFDAALAAFGDEQHLADAVLLRDLRDDLARGLVARGLDAEIGGVASLVEQTQALQAEGIVEQTAALRRNPHVSGLILTQLADAGWEQMAGLVGYWRHPKPALAAFRRALEPRLLHIATDDPCGSNQINVRVQLIEEAGPQRQTYQEATLRVTFDGAGRTGLTGYATDGQAGSGKAVDHAATVALGKQLGGEEVTMIRRLPAEPGRYLLRARLMTADWELEATRPVQRLPDRQPVTGAGVVLLGNGLRKSLPAAATTLPPDWTGPILAYLPSRPTMANLKLAVERARDGAHLCLIGLEPAFAKRLEPLVGMPLPLHTGRGNFMGVHHYVRAHPLFDGLGAPRLADSTFAEVLPAWTLDELPGAEVLAGCFTVPDGGRGFLWRASVQTLPFGDGRLTFWQLGLGRRLGGALGEYLLGSLVRWMGRAR